MARGGGAAALARCVPAVSPGPGLYPTTKENRMAQTVKASELEQETKDRIANEVWTGLSFLGTSMTRHEVEAKVAGILGREDIDSLIAPLFVRPGGGPWIMPAVNTVTELVALEGKPTQVQAPPPPPVELDQTDSPDVEVRGKAYVPPEIDE